MAILNFSKSFTGGGVMNTVKSFLPVVCGVPQSIVNATNNKYLVYISTNDKPEPVTIWAWLQDQFVFNVTSEWTDIASMDSGPIGDVFQLATGRTLASTLSTRRKWKGSSPIHLELKLKFEAIDDVRKEVILPCLYLQSLVLPYGGEATGLTGGILEGEQFFLRPPGPNPFYIPGAENFAALPGGARQAVSQGQKITVDIGGGFIVFDSVIITSVTVVFESRMSITGPVGATATVQFQTYEMLTKERIKEAYNSVTIAPRGVGGITDSGLAVSPRP
jgi:hypothetical protein